MWNCIPDSNYLFRQRLYRANGLYTPDTEGLFNTPAPIGYGVTTPQDLRSYFALGNRFYTTNFGMETQYNLFNPGYSPIAYHLAQNPQLAFTNPMLLGYNLDGMGAAPSVSMPSVPSVGGSAFSNIVKQRIAQQVPQTLAGLEKNLTEILKNDKLNDEQKSRIQAKLDEIKALKNQIQTALSNESSTAQDLYALEAEVTKLQQEISQLGQTLAQEVQNAQASESSDNDANPSGSTDPADSTPGAADEQAVKDEAAGIVGLIFDAVDGIGTKNDQLKNTVAQINKDNIVAVFDSWNENYKDKEGSLVKRIYDDEYWYNGGNDYVKHMVDVFEEKARELGLYSKLIKEFTTINSELTSFWSTNEEKVSQAMDKIHQTIKNAEASKADKAKAQADAKKAEDAKKKAEAEKNEADKAKEAKDLFLADMREIWKDEDAEISDKVKYENGKFKVRIEGKEYYGSDFNELVKNIRNAGYDPEQYLKKQQLQAAA